MNLKKCSKCGKEKELSQFYFRKKGPRTGQYYEKCTECMKLRGRNYYHKHHKRQLKLANKRSQSYLIEGLKFLAIEKNRPCADCGKYYPPWVMDFDHINTKQKVANVAWLRRFHKVSKIKNEIEKCDLVCANCHRNRTLSASGKNFQKVVRELEAKGVRFNWKIF